MNRVSYTTEDFYESYAQYMADNPLYLIDKHTFKSVLRDYFKALSYLLIEKSAEIKLPSRMGSMCIVKRKPRKFNSDSLRVDFKASRDMKKMILHLNEHSDGYNYRFHWFKGNVITKNKSMYELVMSRANKRRLAYLIKNKLTDYIEV